LFYQGDLSMKNLIAVGRRGARVLLAAVFLILLVAGFASPVAADSDGGPDAVYTITNAAEGNEVVVFDRAPDGNLTFQGMYPTDGLGTGAGLGSQGALALGGENNRLLFTVNAGSNEISVFAVQVDGLELLDVVDSGGEMPISLTINDRLLYVLNAGGSGNITGFLIRRNGHLSPLEGSTQPLSNGGVGAAPGPAQISFDQDGSVLVVTEKMSNMIDVYEVRNRRAQEPVTYPSAGQTPFGFAFDRRDHLIVSEAFGGAANASALSSYKVDQDQFEGISASIPTTQTAACWVVLSKNERYAYTTNTGSSSISSYRIGSGGDLTLLDAQAGLTGEGSSPIDMALSNHGRFLYAISGGTATISAFQVAADGSLEPLGEVSVPAGSLGLAAQ
jgi:6-phosphogluconolactonase (cycloisomerase 2 family)